MANDDFAEIRALVEQASPLPWTCFHAGSGEEDWRDDDVRVCATAPGGDSATVCQWCVALAGDTDDETKAWTPETIARWTADGKFIAAARSAVPQLLQELDATKKRLAALLAWTAPAAEPSSRRAGHRCPVCLARWDQDGTRPVPEDSTRIEGPAGVEWHKSGCARLVALR